MSVAVIVGGGGGAPGFGVRGPKPKAPDDTGNSDSFAALMAGTDGQRQSEAFGAPAQVALGQAVQMPVETSATETVSPPAFEDVMMPAMMAPMFPATSGSGDPLSAVSEVWSVITCIAGSATPSLFDSLSALPHSPILPATNVVMPPPADGNVPQSLIASTVQAPGQERLVGGTENQITPGSHGDGGSRADAGFITAFQQRMAEGELPGSKLSVTEPYGRANVVSTPGPVLAGAELSPSKTGIDAPPIATTARQVSLQGPSAWTGGSVDRSVQDVAMTAAMESVRNTRLGPNRAIASMMNPDLLIAPALAPLVTVMKNDPPGNSDLADIAFIRPAHPAMTASKQNGAATAPSAQATTSQNVQSSTFDLSAIANQGAMVPTTTSHSPSPMISKDTPSGGMTRNAHFSSATFWSPPLAEIPPATDPMQMSAPATPDEGLHVGNRMSTTSDHTQTALLFWPGSRDIARQLTVGLARAQTGGTEIVLNPVELGKVRMTLLAGDGTITVQIIADRPETADLMRRHIDSLAQEFRALGYQSVGFSFGPDHDRGQQTGRGHDPDTSSPAAPARGDAARDDNYLSPVEVDPTGAAHRSAQLDLRM